MIQTATLKAADEVHLCQCRSTAPVFWWKFLYWAVHRFFCFCATCSRDDQYVFSVKWEKNLKGFVVFCFKFGLVYQPCVSAPVRFSKLLIYFWKYNGKRNVCSHIRNMRTHLTRSNTSVNFLTDSRMNQTFSWTQTAVADCMGSS